VIYTLELSLSRKIINQSQYHVPGGISNTIKDINIAEVVACTAPHFSFPTGPVYKMDPGEGM
jgi:hypothetical protein